MLQVAEDFRAEVLELHAFLETLEEADWCRPTLFLDWTPWDVLAHLHYFDQASLFALGDPEAFDARRRELVESLAAGRRTTELQRAALRELDAPTLLARWKAAAEELAEGLSASDPKRRLPWFGPDMGVAMFTTARLMETWTFVNRGLEIPGPPPHLRLKASSGTIWEWNEPSETERIEGEALDFCWTVTQVRNVADTDLQVVGPVAREWMAIAQCFAGGPVDPPAPGTRRGA